MIPVPEHMSFAAYYTMEDVDADGKPKKEHLVRPVIGWDTAGQPLVPDHLGRLVAASSLSGLESVSQQSRGDVVGVLPGGAGGYT